MPSAFSWSFNMCIIFSSHFLRRLRQQCDRPAGVLTISSFPFSYLQFIESTWTKDRINLIRMLIRIWKTIPSIDTLEKLPYGSIFLEWNFLSCTAAIARNAHFSISYMQRAPCMKTLLIKKSFYSSLIASPSVIVGGKRIYFHNQECRSKMMLMMLCICQMSTLGNSC